MLSFVLLCTSIFAVWLADYVIYSPCNNHHQRRSTSAKVMLWRIRPCRSQPCRSQAFCGVEYATLVLFCFSLPRILMSEKNYLPLSTFIMTLYLFNN
mgnify:CR=1 FL=1